MAKAETLAGANDSEWDLVIAGAGFSGLVAAQVAVAGGLRTLIVEADAGPGGAAAISAGIIWAPDSAKTLSAYVPEGDLALQRAYCGRFQDAVAMLKARDLPLTGIAALGTLGFGIVMEVGRSGDRREFMALMARDVVARGATIRYRAPLASAAFAQDRYVIQISGPQPRTVRSRALLFATGGFQANTALLDRFVGKGAGAALLLRSSSQSRGAGLVTALSLGAATSRNMQRFYGHTMPDAAVPIDALQPLTAYIARQSVVLNRKGLRFVDESEGRFEEVILQEGWSQPDGRYFLIFDAKTYRTYGVDTGISSALPKLDRLEGWRRIGASVIEADTLEQLAARLGEREGVDAAQTLRTVAAFNTACRDGTTAALSPPRLQDALPVVEPPFYAVRARGGITATCGGIRVDPDCRVVNADGNALPRCYACGVDAGGVFGRTYGGFLGWSLVSGYLAGLTALGDLRARA